MKIAVVIPSLFEDEYFLLRCLNSVGHLKPRPYKTIVTVNDGSEGLKKIRTDLFDRAFKEFDCDLALQCSSDFQLFPDILKHVDPMAITTFSFLNMKLSMPIQLLKFLISPNMWTGCYCIPRNAWEILKPYFDGNDTSIKNHAEFWRMPIKRVRSPKYRLMRPSKRMIEFVRDDLGLTKKILKLGAWF